MKKIAKILAAGLMIAVVAIIAAASYNQSNVAHHEDLTSLLETIETEEGFEEKPYRDTRGFLSIGYGTNLDSGISQMQAYYLLVWDVNEAHNELAERWKPFKLQKISVRNALTDMAYQLGVDGTLEFHKMLAAVAAGDFAQAVKEIENSKWIEETPKRAERIIRVFRAQQ